jgi:hypothetical protein
LLAALRVRQEKDGLGVWTTGELREIGREIGQHKSTARSAVEGLTLSPYMMPTVGGWKLAADV